MEHLGTGTSEDTEEEAGKTREGGCRRRAGGRKSTWEDLGKRVMDRHEDNVVGGILVKGKRVGVENCGDDEVKGGNFLNKESNKVDYNWRNAIVKG